MIVKDTIKFINIITNREDRNPYLFYFYFKSKFRNSIIYNYTPEKLSKLTGVSINTVRKYIGILKEDKMVKMHLNNLVFVSIYKVKSRYDDFRKLQDKRKLQIIFVKTRPWITFDNFKDRINLVLIHNNIQQQKWMQKCKEFGNVSGNLSSCNLKDYKKFNKHYKTEETSYYIRNSCRQLSRVLCMSISNVAKLLIRLKEKGYISLNHEIQLVTRHKMFDYDYYKGIAYFFSTINGSYIHLGSVIKTNKELLC